MRLLRLAPLAAAAVLLAAPSLAQGQNNYGSIYSRYGFGERLDFGTSQSAALGHAGVAVRHPSYHTLSNPALWSDAVVTTFSASASVAAVRGEDALSPDASVGTAGDLAGLHLGVPLLPGRLGLVVGYRPYSRVNYRSAVRDRVVVEGDTAAYTLNLEGSGGLQQLSAGLGLRLGPAQLGASADLVFGTGETLQRTDFDGTDFLEPRQAEATRAVGVTATLGGAVTARGVGGDDGALTLGGALTLPTALDASRSVVLGESLDRDTLVAARDGDATLPLVARAGLAYEAGGRWLAAVDGLYEPWGGFESSLPVGGFDAGAGLDALRDRWRVGGGVELTPAGRDFRAGVLRRTSYRLGGYAERGLYAPGGADVTTLALTGGLSVPNRFTGARIDLGFEVGTRGSTEGVLVRDTFVKGTFTLNFGERWFVRRRFD
jgi:hypothetical protein